MKIITGFEEQISPKTKKQSEPGDNPYIQVFEALKHDQKVAENVFARVAKTQLRARHPDASYEESRESKGRPVWVSDTSIVLELGHFELPDTAWAKHLEDLVQQLSDHIKNTSNGEPALLDALTTRIQKVSDLDVRFSVKQKWLRHE